MSLAEIGILVLDKNDLQIKRHSIRYKLYRAKDYLKVKRTHKGSYEGVVGNKGYLPKRFHTMSIRDMRLIVLKYEHEMASVKLDIAEYTSRHSSRLKELLKQKGFVLRWDHGSNTVKGLTKYDGVDIVKSINLVSKTISFFRLTFFQHFSDSFSFITF